MNIVVLDGYSLNPGDLSWDGLCALGNTTVHDRTPPELVLERARQAEILLTNKVVLDDAIFTSLPRLRYVGVLATGYNVVDVEAARRRGITVTNIPTYGTDSVAQMTFALLLELCHHVQDHSDAVRRGKWSRNADFCFWERPLIELAGKTMGVVGFGRIGQRVAAIAHAFGMNVLACDTALNSNYIMEHVEWTSLEKLLRESDIVSLHCPLTPESRGMINRQSLSLMKSTAFLLNTSRGPLIDEADLADALNSGGIAGAGLDVLSVEPPPETNPLLAARNCLITPHIAWATKEARSRLMDIAVENLGRYLQGDPIHGVTN